MLTGSVTLALTCVSLKLTTLSDHILFSQESIKLITFEGYSSACDLASEGNLLVSRGRALARLTSTAKYGKHGML